MSTDAWVAVVLAAVGLLAVYFLPRAQQRPPDKVRMPKRTLVQHKRESWK